MITVRPSTPDELPALAALAETQQHRDDRFVIYCGEDAASIAAEVDEVDDWSSTLWVATEGSTILGWLMADTDGEIGRVWWWGPFISDTVDDWMDLAQRLFTEARSGLAGTWGQEELAFDDRHHEGARLATDLGFSADPASALLAIDHVPDHELASIVRPLEPGDRDGVVPLHDEIFANAHLNGRQLVDEPGPQQYRLVAVVDGRVVGYVATEVQPDSGGLIDFVGVAPSERQQGRGRDLVTAAVEGLLSNGATSCFLTVRENNTAARRLYAGLGFEQERMLRPFRKGFTLG